MRKVKAFLLALITAACGSTADPDQGGDFDSNPDDSSSGGRAFAGAMAGMVAGCLIVGGCGGMDGGTETLPDGAAGSMMADAKGSNSKDGSMSDDSLNTNEAGSGGNAGAGGAGGDAGAPVSGNGGGLPSVQEVIKRLENIPTGVFFAYKFQPAGPVSREPVFQWAVAYQTVAPIGKVCGFPDRIFWGLQTPPEVPKAKWTRYLTGALLIVYRPLVQSEVDALMAPPIEDSRLPAPIGIDTWIEKNKANLDEAIREVNQSVSQFTCKQ